MRLYQIHDHGGHDHLAAANGDYLDALTEWASGQVLGEERRRRGSRLTRFPGHVVSVAEVTIPDSPGRLELSAQYVCRADVEAVGRRLGMTPAEAQHGGEEYGG